MKSAHPLHGAGPTPYFPLLQPRHPNRGRPQNERDLDHRPVIKWGDSGVGGEGQSAHRAEVRDGEELYTQVFIQSKLLKEILVLKG